MIRTNVFSGYLFNSLLRTKLSRMILAVVVVNSLLSVSAIAEEIDKTMLHGSAEENAQAETRIHRFSSNAESDRGPEVPRTRIHKATGSGDGKSNQIMFPEFAKVDPDLFVQKANKPFDLESESNSRELMIAWELWHKQLAEQMYRRVRIVGAGGCAYRLTVTRDQHISVKILAAFGTPLLQQEVKNAVSELDGNRGLSFPEGSKRQVAYDSLSFICGRNIKPGFDWNHGDFEKIRETW